MVRRVTPRSRVRAWSCGLAIAAGLSLGVGVAPAIAETSRGYELVSPADKHAGDVAYPGGFDFQPAQAALNAARGDGNAVAFFSYQGFADPKTGLLASYRATRGTAGWRSDMWSPPPTSRHADLRTNVRVYLATPDLETGYLQTREAFDPLDTDNVGALPFFSGGFDVYAQKPSGTPRWVSRTNGSSADADPASAQIVGVSSDGSQEFFETPEQLTDQARASQVGGTSLYVRRGEATELVAATAGGTPVSDCGAVLGTHNADGDSASKPSVLSVDRAITPDAGRVFFSAPDPGGALESGDPSCLDPVQVYVNDHGRVIEISASQRTVPDTVQPASFQGASKDGRLAFFTSSAALTDDAAPGGSQYLYEYNVTDGHLRLLTPTGGVRGVSGISADGSTIYTIQGFDLMIIRNGVEQVAVANILLPADPGTFATRLTGSRADTRVSDDGRTLLFLAEADLTAFRSDGMVEAYVYSDATGTVTCISCSSRGERSLGRTDLFFDFGSINMISPSTPRNLSSTGDRAYFQTVNSIVPADNNDAMDVYAWEDGQVRLISDGRNEEGSYFFDASADGSDIFFATGASLVPQDVDNGSQDIYDARIGGGFPAPSPVRDCSGDDCQGTPRGPPTDGAVVATAFEAPASDELPGESKPGTARVAALNRTALRRFAATGKATLTIVVDASASVTVKGTAIARGKSYAAIGAVTRTASRAGRLAFKVTLTRTARRQLAKQRVLSVRISVVVKGGSTKRTTIKLTSPARRG